MRGRILLQDGRQVNSIEKSTKINERDQRTRSEFLREILEGAGEAFAFFLAPFSFSILLLLPAKEKR